jgi:hypothetical protein
MWEKKRLATGSSKDKPRSGTPYTGAETFVSVNP